MPDDDAIARHLPLKPALFWILLVLIDGVRHGYALLKEIDARTDGRIKLEAGNLYRYVKKLLDAGLIEEVDAPPETASADDRRRYYAATPLGREVARAEAERMRSLVSTAEALRLIAPDSGGHA